MNKKELKSELKILTIPMRNNHSVFPWRPELRKVSFMK